MTPIDLDPDDTAPPPVAHVIGAATATDVHAGAQQVVDWAGHSRQGTARQQNQDRWGHRDGRIFAVADGMGGHANGEVAAATAIDVALDVALDATAATWLQRIGAANDAVRASRDGDARPAGTTLVAVEVTGSRATVVSVGDSRVYRLRDGCLEVVTEDHTVRGELLTAGIDADRHAAARETRGLTSYLGIDPDRLRIDVVDIPLVAGDRLLLCSDGVSGALESRQLETAVGRGSCRHAVDDLFERLDQVAARDDATAIILEINGPEEP